MATSEGKQSRGFLSLEDKVILVTGGARGLGAASARALVDGGAQVIITDIDVEAGELSVRDLRNGALFLEHDVSEPAAWRKVVDDVVARFGRIDGLLNCAGVVKRGDIASTTPETLDLFYRVNQKGVFLGMQTVLEPMKKAGRGVIVNLSSCVGMRGIPGMIGYVTSKWAVRGMTRSAALEFAPFGIRVNAIMPGQFETRMIEVHTPEEKAAVLGMTPAGRFGEPDEVAALVRYLMSNEAAYVSGAEISIDGAMMA